MKKNNHSCLLFIVCCLATYTTVTAQTRVIGYLPMYGNQPSGIAKIPFQKITHLNLAFIRADSTGILQAPPVWIDSIISAAHVNHVKVLGSIGGGNAPAYYARLLDEGQRAFFIEQVIAFSLLHQLDGIDIDLEGALINDHYEIFLAELSRKLKRKKKLLTAAIATWVAPKITDGALGYMDFVNIMSYDKTGPWTPDRPGPHSPLSLAIDDIDYWHRVRKVPANKLMLGLPFYGYRFTKKLVTGISFAEIVTGFPGSAQKDSLHLSDSVSIYYNGTGTIRAKTRLAMEKAGGVMIWQLLQDAEGSNSLLDIINETMHPKNKR